jgi:rRNA maturation endonuclease Nob1
MGISEVLRRFLEIVGLSPREERSARPVIDYPYECVTCEVAFSLQHYVCPECGSFSVESRREALARLTG